MSEFRPTDEQKAIEDADLSSFVGKIEGRAGSAKTTTLSRLAFQRATPGLYLVFNKPAAVSAKGRFPNRVPVKTMHSIAYNEMMISRVSHKTRVRLFPDTIRNNFRLPGDVRAAKIVSKVIFETVENFCSSADPVLTHKHVRDMNGLSRALAGDIADVGRKVYSRMMSFGDSFPMTHSAYLKAWQCAGAPMPPGMEWFMFDEAQDASEVQIAAMLSQEHPVTWVGDPHQQIYRWRGAVDAMGKMPGDPLFLSMSFRFGPELADLANKILSCKPEGRRPVVPIRGREGMHTEIGNIPVGMRYAFLARTNAVCFREADAFQGSIYITGPVEDMFRVLLAAYRLKHREPVGDCPEISRFRSWGDLVSYATNFSDMELLSIKGLVESYGYSLPRRIEMLRGRLVGDQSEADLVVSTFHRSKGLEWDAVRISPDGMTTPGEANWTKLSQAEREDEINLVHVAVTRAKRFLDPGIGVMEFVKEGETGCYSSRPPVSEVPDLSNPGERLSVSESPFQGGVAGVFPSSRPASILDKAPSEDDVPSSGAYTSYQRRMILESMDLGHSAMKVASVVRRSPDMVSLHYMQAKGASDSVLVRAIQSVVYKLGSSEIVRRQVSDALGAVGRNFFEREDVVL